MCWVVKQDAKQQLRPCSKMRGEVCQILCHPKVLAGRKKGCTIQRIGHLNFRHVSLLSTAHSKSSWRIRTRTSCLSRQCCPVCSDRPKTLFIDWLSNACTYMRAILSELLWSTSLVTVVILIKLKYWAYFLSVDFSASKTRSVSIMNGQDNVRYCGQHKTNS